VTILVKTGRMATNFVRFPEEGSISLNARINYYTSAAYGAQIYAFGMGFAEIGSSGVKGGEQADRRN
jgi:hypothetical protein